MTTPVASNGKLSVVYKAAAGKKAHIIFDVTGYFLPGTEDAAYNTLAPTRVLDSRAAYGIGLTNRFHTGVPRQLVIAGNHGVPADAVAVTANLTVVGQTKGGFVSITPTSVPSPDDVEPQLPRRRHAGQRAHGEAGSRRRHLARVQGGRPVHGRT